MPLPCRPYAPDLKGKVESAVGYTQASALKGDKFETIDEENTYLAHWNEHCAANAFRIIPVSQMNNLTALPFQGRRS